LISISNFIHIIASENLKIKDYSKSTGDKEMIEVLNPNKSRPSPTLNTILMVEDTLKNSLDSVVTIAELKKMVPRQVNHNTLMVILNYLEQGNKIVVGLKGITWIHSRNENLRKAVIQGLEL
jgi:exosome complex RNA-binding protein Rrp4